MNGLIWFWYLTSFGIMGFLLQAGFALILRAERSGKKRKVKEEVGSVFDNDPRLQLQQPRPRGKK